MKSPTRLKKIRLSELSLVDRPANPHAVIVIAKRVVEPVMFEEALRVIKFNPNHHPAGSSQGGQFAPKSGGGASGGGPADTVRTLIQREKTPDKPWFPSEKEARHLELARSEGLVGRTKDGRYYSTEAGRKLYEPYKDSPQGIVDTIWNRPGGDLRYADVGRAVNRRGRSRRADDADLASRRRRVGGI